MLAAASVTADSCSWCKNAVILLSACLCLGRANASPIVSLVILSRWLAGMISPVWVLMMCCMLVMLIDANVMMSVKSLGQASLASRGVRRAAASSLGMFSGS